MEKGISLYLTIIILAILLAISLGISTIFLGQTRMMTEIGNSIIAFYAGDTGIENMLYQDKLCRIDCPPFCSECDPEDEECLSNCREEGEPCPCPSYCEGYPDACLGLPDGYVLPQPPDWITLDNSSKYKSYFFKEDNGIITIQSAGWYKDTRRFIEITR